MRVRFTVMALVADGNIPPDQGRWIREAGERPARTRHCDRGCRTQAASSRSHWAAASGLGKARIGRARKPGDLPPTTKPKPSWKGVARSTCTSDPRRPGGRCCVARRGASARWRRTWACGWRGRATRSCRGRRRRPAPGTFTKDGDPAHSVLAHQRGRRARARRPVATGRAQWRRFGDYERADHQGRDARLRRGATRRAPTGRSGTTTSYASSGRVQRRRCRRATTSCSSRAASAPAATRADAAADRRGAGLGGGRAQPFDVTVSSTTRRRSTRLDAITTEEPAAGAAVSAGGRSFTAGADGVARVTVGSRGHGGRPGDQGRATCARRPSRCASDCGRRPGRRRGAPAAPRHGGAGDGARAARRARCSRASGRRGRCAARWPPIPRGCWR